MSHLKQPLTKIPWDPFPRRLLPLRFINPNRRKRKVKPLEEWHIVRGDKVEIVSGKDKGKQGTVCLVARKKNHVYIKGLNTHQRYLKPEGDFPGGFVPSEAPLHVSQVKLVDPSTGFATEVTLRYSAEGKRVRVSLENGRIIPKPPFERADFKSRSALPENEFDTEASEVSKATYIPSLLFFHEEIMKEYDIKPTIAKSSAERRDRIFAELQRTAIERNGSSELSLDRQPSGWMNSIINRFRR